MKLLLDENISRRIVPALQQEFPGTTQASLVGLDRAEDRALWEFEDERLMPGDTVVVSEELERWRFTKELKDWTQILYQFALGVAGLKVLSDL